MLGVITVWNEADCVANALNCLLESEHDVHVFDHGSTDGTPDILIGFGRAITVHRLDRRRVPFVGLFKHISNWIAGQRQHDWITFLPADELLFPPNREPLRRAHIEKARRQGVQVIDPLIRRFWISTADKPDEPNYLERLRHFILAAGRHCPRGWLRELTRIMPHGLHRQPWLSKGRRPKGTPWPGGIGANVYWPKGTKISRDKWQLDHYPVRSLEQGQRKVREYPQGPNRTRRRYQEYMNGGKSLVYDASEMKEVTR